MKRTGAKIILDFLEFAGVKVVSGIPGGSNLPLYDELGRSPIRHVLARHEQGAGFIAQGMARVSGVPGVVFVTSGPGATNLVTALADASLDSVPILAISGQVGRSLRGTDAFQEVDTGSITRSVVKFETPIHHAADLIHSLPLAWRIATEGRPGPVILDIPRDVFLEEVELDDSFEFSPILHKPHPINDGEWDGFMNLLESARRPVILTGGGMRSLPSSDRFVEFISRSGIPVISTLMGMGSIPTTHPAFYGMVGMHGSPLSTAVLDRADLLIGMGTRFGDRSTGRTDSFAADAKLVHVDIDRGEHGKILNTDLSIHGDLGEFIFKLNDMPTPSINREWQEELERFRSKIPLDPPGVEDGSRPTGFLRRISRHLPPETRIATDVGQHQMWAARSMHFQFPGQFLTSAGLGTMGFGIPTGIGASLMERERPVVVISGDGSFFMNIQELDTAVQEGCELKVILMDNRQLGMVTQQQNLFMEGRLVASQYSTSPDFGKICEGFGWNFFSCDLNGGDMDLEDFFHARGPSILHVKIPDHELVSPTVPPGRANRDAIHQETVEIDPVASVKK